MPSIQPQRIHRLDPGRVAAGGDYVLYWMQSATRTTANHALELAIERANRHGVPVLALFALDPAYPESSRRHYHFLVEGLAAVAPRLARRRVGFRVEVGPPPQTVARAAESAVEVVTDRSYLRVPRQWRAEVAREVSIPFYEVETNLVVPVETASSKPEYAARTFRPRLHRHLEEFLLEPHPVAARLDGRRLDAGVDLDDPGALLRSLALDASVTPSPRFAGGETEAQRRLDRFVDSLLPDYAAARNDPGADGTSGLSPYLHFGHLSPITVVLAARQATGGRGAGYETLVEELVVRRELSHNFTWYTPDYDSYQGLPAWARQTLDEHRRDPRQHLYSREELVAARTHDPYWNAAMVEMRETGFMHNYMRMYWGKQILLWSESPEEAYATALHLNNRFLLDGRDPNSYAGVGWCFGLHDRPWPERQIVGKVRTMTAGGLERKKDMDGYLRRVEQLTGIRPH